MKKAFLLVSLLLVAPAFGQSTDQTDSTDAATRPAARMAGLTDAELRERVRRAIGLPRTAQESREAGVPDERVREVLRTFRERRIGAGDAVTIFEAENEALRGGGERGNFGAAVQEMKARGLRGRDLADAIHAEQAARGMRGPKGMGHGDDSDGDRGNAKGKGKGKGKGDDR